MTVRLLGTGNQTQTALDRVASLEGVVSTQVLPGVCRSPTHVVRYRGSDGERVPR